MQTEREVNTIKSLVNSVLKLVNSGVLEFSIVNTGITILSLRDGITGLVMLWSVGLSLRGSI